MSCNPIRVLESLAYTGKSIELGHISHLIARICITPNAEEETWGATMSIEHMEASFWTLGLRIIDGHLKWLINHVGNLVAPMKGTVVCGGFDVEGLGSTVRQWIGIREAY